MIPRGARPSVENAHAQNTDAGRCDVRLARPRPRALLYPPIPLLASTMRMHIEDTQRMRLPHVRDIGLCTVHTPRIASHINTPPSDERLSIYSAQ